MPRRSEPARVPPATVHLWWADLGAEDGDAAASLLDAAERLLDAAERERHARFQHERNRASFAGRRALLRRVLAAYTGLAPEAVPISVTGEGKPFSEALEGLDFSCSSSRSLAVVAIGAYERLGVDVEFRPDGVWEPFPVRRYLAEAEIAALRGLAEGDAIRRAARAWVLKEAIAKAVGTGLSHSPSQIELAGDLSRPEVRMLGPWEQYASDGWHAALVADDPTRVAAVAVDGPWEETVSRVWGRDPLRA